MSVESHTPCTNINISISLTINCEFKGVYNNFIVLGCCAWAFAFKTLYFSHN